MAGETIPTRAAVQATFTSFLNPIATALKGSMSELRIYNRTLTEKEVTALYEV